MKLFKVYTKSLPLGMAMGIGPDPNLWIRIRFHGYGSKKIGPVGFESNANPFKFHASGSEKNTQTRIRDYGGPFFYILNIY